MIKVTFYSILDKVDGDAVRIVLSDGWSRIIPIREFIKVFRYYAWNPNYEIVHDDFFEDGTFSELNSEVFSLLDIQKYKFNLIRK